MQRCADVLFNASKNNEVLMTREPTRRFRETLVRLLQNGSRAMEMAEGFVADRRSHVERTIEPALRNGTHVLCDRYMLSTMAYQSVQGVDVGYLSAMHTGVLRPDLTILFDCDPATAAERRRARDGLDGGYAFDRDDALQSKVRDAYLAMAERSGIAVEIVDASKSPDIVASRVRHIVSELLLSAKK
jgi:dTMP kinase